MRHNERAVLIIFGIAQFVVSALLFKHSAPAAAAFAVIGAIALAQSPRAPKKPKSRARR